MKKFLSLVTICALSACGGGAGPAVSISAPTPSAAPSTQPAWTSRSTIPPAVDNISFARLLNDLRRANGAGPVAFDARLGSAAQKHADDMLANNYFSHAGQNGSTLGQRISAEGYGPQAYGENIAKGQTSESQVLNAWVSSPGHQANNINPDFRDFGLGRAGSGRSSYWVLVLATEP